jgi:hypothetical protein
MLIVFGYWDLKPKYGKKCSDYAFTEDFFFHNLRCPGTGKHMSKKVIVLGSGLVGSAIALDLAAQYDVTSVDLNTRDFDRLNEMGIQTRQADLSIPGEVLDQVSGYDLAVGALLQCPEGDH